VEAIMAIETNRSFSELLQDIVANVQQIIRSEVLLAKTEIKEEGTQAVRAGRLLAGGAAVGFYALGFLLLCCVYALTSVVAPWLAALIVGVGLGIIAAVLLNVGSRRFREIRAPEKTIQSLKEDVQWAKRQVK
jgi:uncharacterized membrane protein YqjE